MIKTIEDCISEDRIRDYLAGWLKDNEAGEIESHLAQCPECERTAAALERDVDSLPGLLQQRARTQATTKHSDNMDTAAESSVLPPGDVEPIADELLTDLGQYELLEPLGRGGMGTVHAARHRSLGRRVAIKLLPAPSAADEEALARFQREIRAAGRLQHPSIVAATDAGCHGETHYLVMELIDGFDLSRLSRALGTPAIADACEIIRRAALGLSYAHAQGVVHRDIKPSNLMLSRDGEVKILDFGLAQIDRWDESAAEVTTVGQLMGTLDYMAPEQAEHGGSVDYRADLYSLGATLFRLLCGRPPLAAAPQQSPLEKLRLLAQHTAPSLAVLRSDAPPELVRLVDSLLSRSPAQRPPSAAHVAQRLAPLAEAADLRALHDRAAEAARNDPALFAAASSPAPLRRLPAAADRRPPRRGRRWLLAGLVPLFLVAGVLIHLETDKGQLVIESEVADVQVKVLSEGEPVKEMVVRPGTETTRLRADRYEIVIDAGSDEVFIDRDSFELRRGDTVVARIRRRETPPVAAAVAETAPPRPARAVYQGQTLDEWMQVLKTERSNEKIIEALGAIRALAKDDTEGRIPQLLVEMSSTWESGDRALHAADALSAATAQDDLFELTRKLWHSDDLDEQKFAATLVHHLIAGDRATEPQVIEILKWLADDRAKQRDRIHDYRQETMLFILGGRREHEEMVRITESITDQPKLHSAALQAQAYLNKALTPAVEAFFQELIQKTLTDPESSPENVIVAASILFNDPAHFAAVIDSLIPVFNERLQNLAASPERLRQTIPSPPQPDRSVQVISALNGQAYQRLFQRQGRFNIRTEAPSLSEASVLAALVVVAGRHGELRDALRTITAATHPAAESIDKVVRDDPDFSIQVSSETVSFRKAARRPGQIPQSHSFSSEQFLQWLVHHAVFRLIADASGYESTEANRETEAAVAEAPTAPPASAVYQGRTLDEWLHVLKTERSTETLGEALTAVAALAKDDTDGRIPQLLVDLPHLWAARLRLRSMSVLSAATSRDELLELARRMSQSDDHSKRDLASSIVHRHFIASSVDTVNQAIEILGWLAEREDVEDLRRVNVGVLLAARVDSEQTDLIPTFIGNKPELRSAALHGVFATDKLPPASVKLLEEIIEETLTSADAATQDVIAAAAILSANPDQFASAVAYAGPAIAQRLKKLAANPERLRQTVTFRQSPFSLSAHVANLLPQISDGPGIVSRSGVSILSEAAALIAAAQVIGMSEELSDALRSVVDATRQAANAVDEIFDAPDLIVLTSETAEVHFRSEPAKSIKTELILQWLVHHAAARRLAADDAAETEEAEADAR